MSSLHNTPTTPAGAPTEPFLDDLDHIRAVLDLWEVRLRRVSATNKIRLLASEPDEHQYGRGPSPDALRGRLARLREQETALAAELENREAATRAAGARVTGLDAIVETHGLSAKERDILVLAAAPNFSKRFESLFGQLDGEAIGSDELRVQGVFDALELDWGERIRHRGLFSPQGRLVSSDLITVEMGARYAGPADLLGATVHVTQQCFRRLVGEDGLDDDFLEFSSVEEPKARLNQVVLPEADKARLLAVVENQETLVQRRQEWGFESAIQYGKGCWILLHGPPGTGKTMTAHAVAHHIGKRVLNVDLPTFARARDADRFLPRLLREARIQGAILFLDEAEALLSDRKDGNPLMSVLLTEIERFDGIAIIATNTPEALDPALHRRMQLRLAFWMPNAEAREAIWRGHLPPEAPLADDVDLGLLAQAHRITGGLIKNAVLMAVAYAVQRGGMEIRHDDLDRAARDQAVDLGRAGGLRVPVETSVSGAAPAGFGRA